VVVRVGSVGSGVEGESFEGEFAGSGEDAGGDFASVWKKGRGGSEVWDLWKGWWWW
jgi:hypothetical protein